MKIISVKFYQSLAGKEPVRDWLKTLDRNDCRVIGMDIKTVEYSWPLGMPLVRKMEKNLWEIRSDISAGRIARVLCTVRSGNLVLLHGFIKKTQRTPEKELNLAKKRCNEVLK